MGRIPEYAGDIFQAPEGGVIIHACNCVGSWGAGFAAALRDKFPAAFKVYKAWCLGPNTMQHQQGLLGTTLLIQPQPHDIPRSGRYWIACLFTSVRYGAGKDRPAKILASTKAALESLREELKCAEGKDQGLNLHDKLFTVRINAKAFNTPWEQSRKLLEECGLEVAVINNLELMGAAERSETIASMKANGFDPAASPPFHETDKVD